MVSCGHTVGLNGVLWVYGFMGARWNWRGINNINLSQERRRRRGRRQEISCRVFAKKTIYIAKFKPSSQNELKQSAWIHVIFYVMIMKITKFIVIE